MARWRQILTPYVPSETHTVMGYGQRWTEAHVGFVPNRMLLNLLVDTLDATGDAHAACQAMLVTQELLQ